MLPEHFMTILRRDKYVFVSVSTSDLKGNPNGACKLLVKIEDDYLYLFDYPAWKTWENLKQNPKASISLLDEKRLKCYKINGTVEILEKGPIHDDMKEDIETKRTNITAKHIIESVRGDKESKLFEDRMSEKFILYKLKATKLDEMTFAKTPGMEEGKE